MHCSHVCIIFAKSTNSNFQFNLLFESRIGNFPKTLLVLVRRDFFLFIGLRILLEKNPGRYIGWKKILKNIVFQDCHNDNMSQ